MHNLGSFVSKRKTIAYETFVCDKMYIKRFKKKKLNMEFIDPSQSILLLMAHIPLKIMASRTLKI